MQELYSCKSVSKESGLRGKASKAPWFGVIKARGLCPDTSHRVLPFPGRLACSRVPKQPPPENRPVRIRLGPGTLD